MKRDKLYEIVLSIILVSLGMGMGRFLSTIVVYPGDFRSWFAFIANGVAIFGTIWLLKDYLRRLKDGKNEDYTKKN
jgi:hypothetical protein